MSTADSKLPERGLVPASLKRFIWDIQSMVELADSEREILLIGRDLMARLVASDDWLPAAFDAESASGCAQFQLYRDGLERFTVVSTVLAGGGGLAIDQPGLWEISGALRGVVSQRAFSQTRGRQEGPEHLLQAGSVRTRPSATAEMTLLANAHADRVSASIHVYGGETGRLSRRLLRPDGGIDEPRLGYANGADAPPFDILSIQTEILD